jgi:hypothetical protein
MEITKEDLLNFIQEEENEIENRKNNIKYLNTHEPFNSEMICYHSGRINLLQYLLKIEEGHEYFVHQICHFCGKPIINRDNIITRMDNPPKPFHDNCYRIWCIKEEEKKVPPDDRPEIGEYFSPRGVGYDLAGFVRTKQAGERVIEMFKKVIGKNCGTWLDYRIHEPNWIQVKVQECDCNLEKLHNLIIERKGIITEEMIKECKKCVN